jgi:hypothetical protein
VIEIAISEGRPDALKKALLADLNRRLVETADVRADDIVVVLTSPPSSPAAPPRSCSTPTASRARRCSAANA